MRRLIHVPIVHSVIDMGSLSEGVRQAYLERYGAERWRKSQEQIRTLWQAIEKSIDALKLDYRKARLYQDGLPVCGHEEAIVRELAEKGGANYRILLTLMSRGAIIEGTEEPQLLLQEYALVKATLPRASTAEGRSQPAPSNAGRFRELLDQRDRFIARRIDATLRRGETGILFLGALHRVTEMLPEGIELRTLIEV